MVIAKRALTICAVLGAVSCVDPRISSDAPPGSDWQQYGGDDGANRFSSEAAINRTNVAALRVAWVARVGTATLAGNRGSCRDCAANNVRFESTPIFFDGRLYLPTPDSRVIALNPATGRRIWTFDPHVDLSTRYPEGLTSRGVAAFRGSNASATACASRIVVGTIDSRLIALDATDGKPCVDFGDRGTVHLEPSDELHRRNGHTSVTSPPTIVGSAVVVGATGQARNPGSVRAFDVRSGTELWRFDATSDSVERLPRGSNRRGRQHEGVRVWSVITADQGRNLVFFPTSSAPPDHYGARRPGRNRFASSVVAVEASTGNVVWTFQTVHHDIWDYDVAAPPMLVTLRRGGTEIPAVVIGTKTGMLFVVHRETGVPIFPITERNVPPTDVVGETVSATQPFAEFPKPIHDIHPIPASAFGVTAEDKAFCQLRLRELRNEGIFTPPSLRGTVVWPGFWGGMNWDSMGWDPKRQLVVTTLKRLAMVVRLRRAGDPPSFIDRLPGAETRAVAAGVTVTRAPFVAQTGIPCTPPPWGELVSVDLTSGQVRWRRPLGTVPQLVTEPGFASWGSVTFGGPLLTAGGLVFVAGSPDDRIRAMDIDSGRTLWESALPAGGQASPMTYMFRGRQYVVIAAGGRAGIGSPGDWVVAFSTS